MTIVSWEKVAEQVLGQLIPAGLLTIVPAPAVGAVTFSWYDCGVVDVGPAFRPTQLANDSDRRAHDPIDQNLRQLLICEFSLADSPEK